MNIDTSLLREKFIIKERCSGAEDKTMLIHCPSTRMPITLQSGNLPEETYIVRTNNMHNCVRLVSKIVQNYENFGPISGRIKQINWDELWDNSLNSFERRHTPNRWASIYHAGNMIYSSGDHHQFFDVIEQCDIINKRKYNKSIKMAEKAFLTAGKDVCITYDGNVALVAILSENNGRCSMTLRGSEKTATFNYSIKPELEEDKISLIQALATAADFLDGVQLSYLIGLSNDKLNRNIIDESSDEYIKLLDARKRLIKINVQINSMENRYHVRYRPERPDFDLLIAQTEKFAKNHIVADNDEIY